MKRSLFSLLISAIWLLVSPISHAIVDINNNGLSDLWEKRFNSQQLFPASFGPLADPDGDGWTNLQEAAAGTDPRNANSPDGFLSPSIDHIPAVYFTDPDTNITETISPQTMVIRWFTLPGKQYTLLYSTDLSPTNWQPIEEPTVSDGFTTAYYMPLTQQDGSTPDKLFWRVAIADPVPVFDSDDDGLSNYEEYLAGTDPVISDSDGDTLSDYDELLAGTNPNNADEDGDGLTDPDEIAAGTSSSNQDSDGDAIPDSLDSQPLLSAQVFADADDDGIPDEDDADPNNPRGPKPFIISDNASGNPQCELRMDESSSFILTINNPAGPAPTASDFKLYLNGTEETANITALTTPASATGTQRFNFSWLAKVTTGYPEQTLQNISLRFRDSQNATTWLNLARIDVAEWEGMIGIARSRYLNNLMPEVRIESHFGGVKVPIHFSKPILNTWYRGPKAIALHHENDGSLVACPLIGNAMRYPLLFTYVTEAGKLVGESILDISSPALYGERGILFNSYAGNVQVTYNPGGAVMVAPGQTAYLALPDEAATSGTRALYYDSEGPIYDRWEIPPSFDGSRFFDIRAFTYSGDPQWTHVNLTSSIVADVEASIRPYGAGSLEEPGLPLPSGFHSGSYSTALLPIQSEQWHKIILKVGPDAGAVSNGITLKLGTGESGTSAPQSGYSLQVENSGSFTPLPLTDGKLEMLPTSELYQKLTSPEGLSLFLKRDDTVTESHRLGLDLIPKRSTYPIQRIAALDLPPVEVNVDIDGDSAIASKESATELKPFELWINDDDDTHSPGPPQQRDCISPQVNGAEDLEDLMPVFLGIQQAVVVHPPSASVKYKLKQADGALNFCETSLLRSEAFSRGGTLLTSAPTQQITADGVELSTSFLNGIRDYNKGVILVEGRSPSRAPLVLVVEQNGVSVAEVPIHTTIAARIVLLLHGMNSNTQTWNGFTTNSFDNITTGAANIIDGVIQGTTAPLMTQQGVRCYRLQFGFYDPGSVRVGLEGITAANTPGYLTNIATKRCGDFETFAELGQEVDDAIDALLDPSDHPEYQYAKIVLVGHSRGGIAARAFLQGSSSHRSSVVGLVTTGSPHQGSPMGKIYTWLDTHKRGAAGTDEDDWQVVDLLLREDFDVRRPVIGDLGMLTAFNADVSRLPTNLRCAELVYQHEKLGRLARLPAGLGTYTVFDEAGISLGEQLSSAAQSYILGAGNTSASFVGDGLIPGPNQRFTTLPGFGAVTVAPLINSTVSVLHTEEPAQFTELKSQLKATTPKWFP